MGKVRGEDVIVYIQDVNASKCSDVLGCARSVTFDIKQDMIETSITGSGRFRTYVPGAGSATATLEGLVSIMSSNHRTLTGTLTQVFIPAIPPVYGFEIDTPDLCFPIGGSLTVSNTNGADGVYTIVNYANGGSGTQIIVQGTVPNFTTGGTLDWDEPKFSTERMYDALIAGTNLLFEFYETDDENHYLRKTFSGYFDSITEVASFDNVNTFTANVTVTGQPTIEYG